jgi:anti-sigma regulatory factor (Ser/Thr protein kinase)
MSSTRQQTAHRPRRHPAVTGAPAAEEELDRSYPADPEAAALAREDFGTLAQRHGATDEQVDDIRLLVSEAVTNAARHAYPGSAGPVSAMAAVSAGRITILVSDDGVGPRAPSGDPGAGWGWPLMAALSERFTIRRRSNGGTEVEMRVRIGPDHGPESQVRRGSDSSAPAPPAPRFSTTT